MQKFDVKGSLGASYAPSNPLTSSLSMICTLKKDLAIFNEWYDERIRNGDVFNCQKELETYCMQDINILRLCLLKFRQKIFSQFSCDIT